MWQCKHCKERFVEKPDDHQCVDDTLKHLFKGRKAVLEPLVQSLIQKQHRLGHITISSDKSFITFANDNKKVYAVVWIAEDHLELFMRLHEDAPISPFLKSAARLRIPQMTHYTIIKSISDITPDIMRSLMWAKEWADA